MAIACEELSQFAWKAALSVCNPNCEGTGGSHSVVLHVAEGDPIIEGAPIADGAPAVMRSTTEG